MQPNKFIIIIGVSIVLLALFGVGLFFLIKKQSKSEVYKKYGNNGATSCQNYCTNTGGNWGTKYKRAESAVISGSGGTFNGKTYKNGQSIDVREIPGAIYPPKPGLDHYEPDQSQPAHLSLDCGCSN